MQGLLLMLFGVGMAGDGFTTFLGILWALGVKFENSGSNNPSAIIQTVSTSFSNDLPQIAFATMGTCVILGLNLITADIYEGVMKKKIKQMKVIGIFWLGAIVIDFITSLAGSLGFIKPQSSFLAYILVFIITFFITASPALLRYFVKNPLDVDD